MDCPICGEYGKTYASKPLGAVKIRYRKCDGCKYKYRTFEEIDANPVVRGHEKTPRYPLADPANIICPNCNSATLKHDRKTTQVEGITHFYTCRDCDTKFGIQCELSDPISKARKAAMDAARILCPECAGITRQKAQTKTKTGATIRRECNECEHRFTYRTFNDGRPPFPPLIKAGEITHPVLP